MGPVQLTHSRNVHHCYAIILLQLHHHTTTTILLIIWEKDHPVSCLHRGRLHLSEGDPDLFSSILEENVQIPWSDFH